MPYVKDPKTGQMVWAHGGDETANQGNINLDPEKVNQFKEGFTSGRPKLDFWPFGGDSNDEELQKEAKVKALMKLRQR